LRLEFASHIGDGELEEEDFVSARLPGDKMRWL
jgi:hypothetical protein